MCKAALPARPLRCPACGVALTGPNVAELVTTLRRADLLVDLMRADLLTAPAQPTPQFPPLRQSPLPTRAPSGQPPSGQPPARSWFAGKSVGVILLILGALCVLAAGAVFVAVAWMELPLAVRALILVIITASFGLCAQLALRRGLQATAEAMAVIASGMFVLDLSAARRTGLPGLADLAIAPYEIVAGVLLVAVAATAALAVRSQGHWLWSLDAVVGLGMARAVSGVLRIGGDGHPAALVTVTVVASLLFVGWRRLRFPVAMWSVLVLGAATWSAAVAAGAERAADHVGPDPGRLASAWPALAMALVAGLWSVRLTHFVWRRVAAFLCLLPVLLIFEIVGWSHGWVVGAVVMLAGCAVATVASGRMSSLWSPAVGVSALVLGLSSMVGTLPTLVALAARIWRVSLDQVDVSTGDVAPWLLPLTAVVVLALVPYVTVGSRRLRLDQHHTAGVFAATLAVLPILYGAGFWVSFSVLVVVAAGLLCGARLWRNDVLLLLALSLLAILGLYAYFDGLDDLADPLAWTVIALACLAWALTEGRLAVWAGFLTAAGLFALPGAVQWLGFVQVPRSYQGLVIVVIGSLGLPVLQRLRDTNLTRLVGEGLSVTWVLAGLALAETSASHRAAELTVAGVAFGITAYLSPDRQRAGWVSGVLLTVASWIRLADNDIQVVEWYTLPAATALLVYGTRRFRRDPGESTESTESSLRCLGPGLALALVPSLVLALREPVSWRGLVTGVASVVLVAVGVKVRLAAPFILGVLATALLALRNIWPVAAFIPRWTLLFLIGGVLLGMGMTWESRVNDVRTASRYVRGLR